MFKIAFGIIILFVLTSCSQSSINSVTVVNHGKYKEYKIHTASIKDSLHLTLADFAEDFEFIAIETSEECMISYGVKYYINDTFFLMEKMNGDIYQFDRSGKFIRIIVKRGRGPSEFSDGEWTVDDVNQILLLSDQAKSSYFLRFDLITGEYLGDLNKASVGRTNDIEHIGDSIIVAAPCGKAEGGKIPDYLFFQDYFGNKTASVPAKSNKTLLWNDIIYSYSEGLCRLELTNNDTIFTVDNYHLIPYLTFDFGKDNPPDRLMLGHIEVELHMEVESWLTIEVGEVSRATKDKNGQINDLASRMSFIALDKKANKAYHRGSLFIDPTNDPNGFWITFCKNGNFIKPYEAIQLLELAENALNNPDFPEKYRADLEKVTHNLNPGDNPILLVGRYR